MENTLETAFDNITKHISSEYIDVFALIGDNHHDDYDRVYQQISQIKVMTFYLLAEHKQSEKLSNLISSAISNYIESDIIVSSSQLNKNIEINLENIYSNFDNIFTIFCKKISALTDLELPKSVKEKLSINTNNKKAYIIFILNMLYQFTASESRELFLTYLPSIIYAFHANYKKRINVLIKKLINKNATKEEISEMINFLTEVSNDIPKYYTRDYVKKYQNVIKSFLFVSLYNAIITNYRKNFIINFLWFERNVGFYQYYLTATEYSKVINYISKTKSTDTHTKIDISIPTALYLIFKDNTFNEDLWKTFDLVLTANDVLDNEEIYNFMNGIFTNISADFSLDYNSIIAYFSKKHISEPCSLEYRFMTYSIQVLYYRELLCKENFIKNNMYFYSFHCDKISDSDFKLEDVTFDLWYTSDDLADMDFNIINADDKYYIVSSMLKKTCPMEDHFILNDSIIIVKKAKRIWLNGNLIERTASMLLKLENVNFHNLTIEHKKIDHDKIIDFFTSKDIVESFNKLYNTETNKIYMFLGLHYFTNVEDYPQGKKNIIALYVNNLMEYQNFFPIRGTSDYSKMQKIINRYLSTLRIYGSSTASGCSTSCSGSGVICKSNNVSINCSVGSTQGDAPIVLGDLCDENVKMGKILK